MRSSIAETKHTGVLSAVDLLLALEAVGSATQAARQLDTSAATVLRRLDRLEAELGVRLFERYATGLRPTPAFALVRPWAEQAQAAAVGMLRQLSQTELRPAGLVRIATPPVVASLFIVPALPSLHAEFPDIVVELAPATAVVDLTQREADLAIRTVKPSAGELVAQRLSTYRLTVVGSRKLRPLVRNPGQLTDYPWLDWASALSTIPESQWRNRYVPDARVVFRSSELTTLLAAAQSGLGALVTADVVAERAGGLEPLPVETPPLPEGAIWLVTHSAMRQVPRVAAVWEWISRQMSGRATG